MKNLQFDTFLCKIHGIVAEIYANTPNIALARFIFPTPLFVCMVVFTWTLITAIINSSRDTVSVCLWFWTSSHSDTLIWPLASVPMIPNKVCTSISLLTNVLAFFKRRDILCYFFPQTWEKIYIWQNVYLLITVCMKFFLIKVWIWSKLIVTFIFHKINILIIWGRRLFTALLERCIELMLV